MLPSINIYLDAPRHKTALLSSTTQVVVELGECRERYCEDRGKAIVVDSTILRFHRLVVMPESCAWGYGTQQYWADADCAGVLLFSAHLNACDSHGVWKPKPRGQFRTPMLSDKWRLHFRLEAVSKMIPEKLGSKKDHFGVDKG